MRAFRDSDWHQPEGIEVAWQGGIVGKVETVGDRDRVIPCIYTSGQNKGYFGTKTNLTQNLDGDQGECSVNEQIDPRKINGVTIQGGQNFLRASGVQLGDLALATARYPDGRSVSVPAIVVDSGGITYPAMGTVSLNANLLSKEGMFQTREEVLSLSIDAPRTVRITILLGSFGYHLQRPFTNVNIRERLKAFASAAGYDTVDQLADVGSACRATRR